MTPKLKSDTAPVVSVLVVDDNAERAVQVEQSLLAAGYRVLGRISTATGLLHQIEQHHPDVIVIDIDSPDRDVLESLSIVNDFNPTPVVMFTDQEDRDFIQQAVTAGVTAYTVGGINPERVKPVIDVAMAQFGAFQSVRQALEKTRLQLEERKLVEQAKGLLMAEHGIDEPEAHQLLQKIAMDNNQTVVNVARQAIALMRKKVARRKP